MLDFLVGLDTEFSDMVSQAGHQDNLEAQPLLFSLGTAAQAPWLSVLWAPGCNTCWLHDLLVKPTCVHLLHDCLYPCVQMHFNLIYGPSIVVVEPSACMLPTCRLSGR